jgi:predicted GTPase
VLPKAVPVLGIVGHSKTGKTTLTEKLVGSFSERGLRVATVKHHPHDIQVDEPLDLPIPCFRRDDIPGITSLILDLFQLI